MKKGSRKGIVASFATKYVVDESGCWLWHGSKMVNGYGLVWSGERMESAHRTSWRIHRGEIPDGLFVCHTCDVRNCVNPDHLFLGTNTDNMRDCSAKGRTHGKDKTHCPKGHPYAGENLYVRSSGSRTCVTCDREKSREWKRKQAARKFYIREHNEMVAQYGFGARL